MYMCIYIYIYTGHFVNSLKTSNNASVFLFDDQHILFLGPGLNTVHFFNQNLQIISLIRTHSFSSCEQVHNS